MGRPLNKKYFGNRNVGTLSTTADNGIGGQGIASVTIAGTNNAYVAVPSVSFAATPKLPGGVTATGSAVMGVVGETLVAPGTGYAVNDVITIVGAGAGTAATLTVTGITGGGATGPISTVNITTAGNYTTITDVSAVGVTGAGNNDATFNLTFKVNSITITEKGSGYTGVPAITMTGNATKVAVLTVDTGTTVGVTANQENAISMTAFLTGGSAVAVDILKQVSTNRYKVTDGTRTGIVQLQSSVADAAGEGSVLATDVEGNTYYATKITAHKATLTRVAGGANYVYATGQAAPWKFDAAAGVYVQLANA